MIHVFFHYQMDFVFIEKQSGIKEKRDIYYKRDRCMYVEYTRQANVGYLKCTVAACGARAKLKDGIFSRTNEVGHNHGNHEAEAEADSCYTKLKEDVLISTRSPKELFNDATRGVNIFYNYFMISKIIILS